MTHTHTPGRADGSSGTAAAPSDLRTLVDDYRTCELATLTRRGLPMAWPTAPLVEAGTGRITITTSIALPQKAYNVRRDPRVAVLFSDPTGSGRRDLPQVLVRGTAVCPDEIRTSPTGLEEYWSRLYERQPSSGDGSGNAVSRRLMDWYHFRLVITVTPTSVEVLPPLAEQGVPERAPVRTRPAPDPGDRLRQRLPGFGSAVLAWPVEGEPPVMRRVALAPDASAGRFSVASLGGGLPDAGPASVLLHRHDDRLGDLQLEAAAGRVEHGEEGTTFRPERVVPVPGADGSPLGMLRTVRDLRRAARRYLDARGLERPTVAWSAFAALR